MSGTPNTLLAPPVPVLNPRFTCLADWLAWQESLHFTAIELGLDRCNKVAQRLDLLQPDSKVISVSGTNGKGSSAAMLDAMLRKAGYRVGTYTSPHLSRYNERICIDGKQVTDAQLCASFDRIDRARGDISLTYFEFGTLAALDIFQHAQLDIVILEVGLGGRLDAVNILDADVALVVTIDLDHEKWLGYDRDSIGREKAGIFRPGRPAVCSDPAPPQSIAACAQETGARLYQAGRDFSSALQANSWIWHCADSVHAGLPKPGVNNNRQVQNAAGVLMALETLAAEFPVSLETIKSCLRDFRLAGRFQTIPGKNPFILDVAHNPQAVSALVENVKKLPGFGETHVVIGMLRDKNHDAVFRKLTEVADHWYLVELPEERAAGLAELGRALEKYTDVTKIGQFNTVVEALSAAETCAGAGDRIIVTGSFVTVGAALDYLRS
ncbi:MAG: bifunctional tetrahydrofolate synthase/dihydrofolate synthase [Gammaproteobacteria bacterium]|nr:bifunctional tetrahydrofolate synthase/dihydrofolate synthase [Gammaproteobacteria bacterium]MCY4283369.1 bifunctional tetrahydrofolate synthase/dihydrofolate synthase [Gammaproteobacteria bacterium]MCY4338791.1 bifunctional tetrahydrofolate synthase/dihydrofolate synthase [Gammaproteobacteria bacterium]